MSALIARRALPAPSERWAAAGRAAVLLVALGALVLLRAATNGTSVASALASGAVFGVTLILMAKWPLTPHAWRLPGRRSVAIGLIGGLLLIAVPVLIQPGPRPIGLRPEPFAAWALVTSLVAVGEEALLRGALFDAVKTTGGLITAIAVTSVVFALMHVPLYGWSVVPVDIGAGVILGGLRILGRGVSAPAVAHTFADLATWWL